MENETNGSQNGFTLDTSVVINMGVFSSFCSASFEIPAIAARPNNNSIKILEHIPTFFNLFNNEIFLYALF